MRQRRLHSTASLSLSERKGGSGSYTSRDNEATIHTPKFGISSFEAAESFSVFSSVSVMSVLITSLTHSSVSPLKWFGAQMTLVILVPYCYFLKTFSQMYLLPGMSDRMLFYGRLLLLSREMYTLSDVLIILYGHLTQ